MIPLFAAVPPAPHPGLQVAAVRLYKGAEVAVAPGLPRYFDVSEAVLDEKEREVPQPLEYAAAVTPQRSLLLRFGSLDAVLPPGAVVRSATLRLTAADAQPIKISSFRRVLVPWKGAGPSVLSARLRKDQPTTPRQSASFAFRRRGSAWNRAGAQSDRDSAPIEGVTISEDGTITGLASTVQAMADRWWENNGFLLQFSSESLLGSSLSPMGRPELTIEYEAGPLPSGADLAMTGFREQAALVANVGSAPSAPYRVRARTEGAVGEWSAQQPALAPGQSVQVPVTLSKTSGPAAGTRVVLEIEPQDDNPRNDATETFLSGKEIRSPSAERAYVVSRAVRLWNAAAEASRYGFAPEGPDARLSYVGVGESTLPDENSAAIFPALSVLAGIPETASRDLDAERMPRVGNAPKRGAADRFPGINRGGDARGEAAITYQTDLLNAPYEDPLIRRLALESTGGLSLYDVAALNAGGEPPLPRAAVAQFRNASGRPLAEQAVVVYTGDGNSFTEAARITTNATGTIVLSAKLLETKILAFEVGANGETEVGFLKDWQFRAAAARGNIAPIMGVRLNLPSLPVVRDVSLASGKFVTDSSSSAANLIGTVVDGDAGSAFRATYPKNGYLEIDLGRDRTVAEVAIRAEAMPRRFDLRMRGTGEEATASTLWAEEGDWAWTRANRPDQVLGGAGVLYRGTAQRGRYLRIVFPEGGEVALNEILVYAARVAG